MFQERLQKIREERQRRFGSPTSDFNAASQRIQKERQSRLDAVKESMQPDAQKKTENPSWWDKTKKIFDAVNAKRKEVQAFNASKIDQDKVAKNRQDLKELPGKISEVIAPSRGFDTKGVIPTAKETAIGLSKYPGRIAYDVMELASNVLFPKSEEQLRLEEEALKNPEFAQKQKTFQEGISPQTAGEAKAMQGADIATVIPMGSLKLLKGEKLISEIAKSTDSKFIASVLNGKVQDAEGLSKILKNVSNKEDVAKIVSESQPLQEGVKIFHGGLDGKLKINKYGNIDFGNTAEDVAQFSDGTVLSPDISGLNIKKVGSDEELFNLAIGKEKEKLIKEGVDVIQSPNRYTAINPEKFAKDKGLETVKRTDQTIGQKERGFVTSVKESTVAPEVKAGVEGTYTPKPNTQLMGEAKGLLEQDVQINLKGVKDADQKVAATIQHAINVQDTNPELAANLFNNLSESGTELGRGVQAFAMIDRMKPETIGLSLAGKIKKYNRLNPNNKIPELGGDQLKKFSDDLREVLKKPAGIERDKAIFQFKQKMENILPSSLWDKAITTWKAGLLTGLQTSGVNILSNATMGLAEQVKNVPATLIDKAVSVFTGKVTKALTGKGVIEGGMEGTKKGLDYLFSGFDPRNMAKKFDYKQTNFGNSKLGKILSGYSKTVFRSMGAADQPFYYAALRHSIAEQAIVAGRNQGLRGKALDEFTEKFIKNLPDDVAKIATKDAEIAVFQNNTKLGELAKKFDGPVGDFVAPFKQTPSAVATSFVNYSPVGIVKTIIENIGKGKFNQKEFVEGLGRSITGTGLTAIGGALMYNGYMTLQAPKSETERVQWEAEGKQPNSISLDNGKTWKQAGSLGPIGLTMLLGGYFAQGLKETGSVYEATKQAMASIPRVVSDQSFLKGVSGILNAMNDPVRYADITWSNTVGSVVPAIVGAAAKATDPVQRIVKGAGDTLKSRIPGLRETLPEKVGLTGEPLPRKEGPIASMIDPFRSSTAINQDNKVVQEMSRLQKAGENATPTYFGNVEQIYGEKVNLTPEQRSKLQEISGKISNEKWSKIINTDYYNTLSDREKSSLLKLYNEYADNQAYQQVLGKEAKNFNRIEALEKYLEWRGLSKVAMNRKMIAWKRTQKKEDATKILTAVGELYKNDLAKQQGLETDSGWVNMKIEDRANYLVEKTKSMTPGQRVAYIYNLTRLGLISDVLKREYAKLLRK